MNTKLVLATGLLALLTILPVASAQTEAADNGFTQGGWAAIAAGLAVGLAGLGTGIAQAQIGAAAVGATAENEGFLGKSLIYVAIPETIVIFGLLIAFLLIGKIPTPA